VGRGRKAHSAALDCGSSVRSVRIPLLTSRSSAAALRRGLQARNRHDWPTAAREYKAYLGEQFYDFGIWVQLGHALKEAGQLDEAMDAYATALRLDSKDADLMLSLGHLHKLMGHPVSAIFFYRRSAGLDGNQHATLELERFGLPKPPVSGYRTLALRRLHRTLGRAIAGARSAPRRLLLRPHALAARRAVAEANAARDRRDFAAAAQKYKEFLDLRPADFDIWVQLGHMLKECGRHEDSLGAYNRASGLSPHDADLLLSFGHLHKLMGSRDRALACYRASWEVDGNEPARTEIAALESVWNLSKPAR
jgi:tetratricopeptide (TPR) repeat protein